MNKNIFISIIVTAIIVGSGAFYGGMKYSQNKSPSNGNFSDFANLSPEERQQRMQQIGANMPDAARVARSGGFVNGEIISKDDKSLTIKLNSPAPNSSQNSSGEAGSKIVFFSDSTEVLKSVSGTASDLKVGDTIMANGTANQDGSITASSIQLRPLIADEQQK